VLVGVVEPPAVTGEVGVTLVADELCVLVAACAVRCGEVLPQPAIESAPAISSAASAARVLPARLVAWSSNASFLATDKSSVEETTGNTVGLILYEGTKKGKGFYLDSWTVLTEVVVVLPDCPAPAVHCCICSNYPGVVGEKSALANDTPARQPQSLGQLPLLAQVLHEKLRYATKDVNPRGAIADAVSAIGINLKFGILLRFHQLFRQGY